MTGWRDLGDELDLWAGAGRRATFWWRDDDAVEDTPALARLLELRARFGVPVAVAAIPARAEATLARALDGVPATSVLQHGYAHLNHASDQQAKSELGRDRPVAAVLADLAAGRARLDAVFGDAWHPILVPPWNRIDAAVVAALPDEGYRGISAMGPRSSRDRASGLMRIDVHVDPIDWPVTRGFAGEDAVLAVALAHLRRRRADAADADEPTGLMTHHLAHDDGCWAFIETFLAATSAHPAGRWIDAPTAFGLGR
jgi:hypothetical protein